MSFWSGDKLTVEANAHQLISGFVETNIDCAAYMLAVGDQIYVSPTVDTKDASRETRKELKPAEAFTIPPGQFGFLTTIETVRVPIDTIAFISIRFTYKSRGLVNVSGFHVDPGYDGKLVFAVFNAGPKTIHLANGEKCFLIWYADLAGATSHNRRDEGKRSYEGLDLGLINDISGEFKTLEGLSRRIDELDKKQASTDTLWRLLITIATAVGFILLRGSGH